MGHAVNIQTLTDPRFSGLVAEYISKGIQNTIEQLGEFKTNFKPHFISNNWKPSSTISVLLDIKQEGHPLLVRLHFQPEPVAKLLEAMLGDPVDPSSPELLEGVGEISNMIYGLVKTNVNSQGFSLSSSLPKACYTKDLPALIKADHQSLIIPFTINNFETFFEVIAF